MSGSDDPPSPPSVSRAVGGKLAGVLFVFALLGFVIESELTQYVQTTLGFRQPYFVFYCVHSSFFVLFPLHYLYLITVAKESPAALKAGLREALRKHVPRMSLDSPTEFPTWGFSRLVILLTLFVSMPALLWFVAVTLAPLSDVTALWNTNAFFAYVLTVRLFGLPWEPRRLAAVLLATAGAAAVVYGSSSANPKAHARAVAAPLVGDILTLVASILYGIYQVGYKAYAALPTDPHELDAGPAGSSYEYEPLTAGDAEGAKAESTYPPPFGLYANFLTTCIGACTCVLLAVPFPVLHVLGFEKFRLPADIITTLTIAGICLSGVVFNAGLMILLGLWGPVVVSVGNLLTIVLVFLYDIVFGRAVEAVTAWSLLGSGAIVAAFGILAFDMAQTR
ncbi:hypothetical protein BDW22DRAFT_1350236 [Trametopsis cervina]|nr:hypothetical protein BDW22DRAFT_1350236 [Trametopsis cervina]